MRTMRLLKYFNLEEYSASDRKFVDKDDIDAEAAANKQRAFEERIGGNNKIMVGGIYYNPPTSAGSAAGDSFYQSFFSAKSNAANAEAE